MVLQINERKLFFNIWLGLLAFVNDKHKLINNFGHPKKPYGKKPETIMSIKTKLWEDVGIIDEYIDSVRNLSNDQIQILKSWKNRVGGTFIIIRHLKNYSVFIDDKNDLLYGVIGITSPIYEMFPAEILPIVVETSLLPFRDQIIYDSIFSKYNVQIGPNMRRNFKEQYSEIKKNKGIISSFRSADIAEDTDDA